MRGFQNLHNGIFEMGLLRIVSSFLELCAAILIFYFNDVKEALVVNSMLAIIGPIIFMTITSIGLVQISHSLSFGKLILIVLGIAFILIGILK